MTRETDELAKGTDDIEERAAQWIARIDRSGTCEDWARLEEWLARSPRHRAAFVRLAVAWRRCERLRELADSARWRVWQAHP
jgi:ferric-dicitrate binding protein FerR (iron transport regulator)